MPRPFTPVALSWMFCMETYDLAEDGTSTGLMHSSSFDEKIRYASDTYSSGKRCVISAFGFSTPFRTCSTSRGSSRFTDACPNRDPFVHHVPDRHQRTDRAVHADDGDDPTLLHRVDRPMQRGHRPALEQQLPPHDGLHAAARRVRSDGIDAHVGADSRGV